jgi:hypothetical protein
MNTMDDRQDHLEQISEIRSIMERSSRFLSLSGLSGVSVGLLALVGAAFAFWYLDYSFEWDFSRDQIYGNPEAIPMEYVLYLGVAAVAVIVFAVSLAAFFTTRKARKHGLPIWDVAAKRMITELLIPLVTGGLFCLVLLYWGIFGLIAPVTLIFYGLGLISASKYTLPEIRYLGFTEIGLGLFSCFMPRESLLFWAIGFGVLHIIYGIIMYYRHER